MAASIGGACHTYINKPAGEEVWEGAGCSVREPSADKEVPVSKGSEGCSIANPTEDLLPTSTKQEDHTGHTSEEGSLLTSSVLTDNPPIEGEKMRLELIDRLISHSGSVLEDFEGAVKGLASLKRARIIDATTGKDWGVVRLYADPDPVNPRARPSAQLPSAQRRVAGGGPAVARPPEPCCQNCGTLHTPLWRRISSLLLCNACGIYLKTKGVQRDVSLLGAPRSKKAGKNNGRMVMVYQRDGFEVERTTQGGIEHPSVPLPNANTIDPEEGLGAPHTTAS